MKIEITQDVKNMIRANPFLMVIVGSMIHDKQSVPSIEQLNEFFEDSKKITAENIQLIGNETTADEMRLLQIVSCMLSESVNGIPLTSDGFHDLIDEYDARLLANPTVRSLSTPEDDIKNQIMQDRIKELTLN